jgi:hypothetical protein
VKGIFKNFRICAMTYPNPSIGKKLNIGINWRSTMFIGVMAGIMGVRLVDCPRNIGFVGEILSSFVVAVIYFT